MTNHLDELRAEIRNLKSSLENAKEKLVKARISRDIEALVSLKKGISDLEERIKVKRDEWYQLFLAESEEAEGTGDLVKISIHKNISIDKIDKYGIINYK